MSDLIFIVGIFGFIAVVVIIVAIWTQYDFNRQRERQATDKKADADKASHDA